MFRDPTINDFLDNVRWHLSKSAAVARREVNSVKGRLAATGAVQSGRAIIMIFDAIQKEFEAGVQKALGELKRALRRTTLDRRDLRQTAISCLENFILEMKAISGSDQYRSLAAKAVDERLAALDSYLAFAVRQFDSGFLDPDEPEVPSVNNSINVGTMTGSTIQQGSPGASQAVQFEFNIDGAKAALSAFDAAIKAAGVPKARLDEIEADLRTIDAQLSKNAPSLSILKEAGRSLRNIVEGLAAGLMTPGVMAAAPALWTALGLG